MMREIVDDENAVVFAFDVEAAADGTEGRERFLQ